MKSLPVIALTLLSSAVIAQGNSTSVKNVDVKPFSAIKVSGVFTLKLSQGSEGVKMEGDAALMSKIKVTNEGNTLVIKMDDHKEKGSIKKGVTVTLSFRNISSADLSMVGDVITTGATLEACYGALSHTKNIQISIACMAYIKYNRHY